MTTRSGLVKIVRVALYTVGILVIAVLALAVYSYFSLKNVSVYGVRPMVNPPPFTAAAGITNLMEVVAYSKLEKKPLSQSEIELIKSRIPISKTALRLYHPTALIIESSDEVVINFSRGGKHLHGDFWKIGNDWHYSLGVAQDDEFTPVSILDKLNAALPF